MQYKMELLPVLGSPRMKMTNVLSLSMLSFIELSANPSSEPAAIEPLFLEGLIGLIMSLYSSGTSLIFGSSCPCDLCNLERAAALLSMSFFSCPNEFLCSLTLLEYSLLISLS